VDRFLYTAYWKPRHVILAAGALHYTRYGVFTRWMMRKIAAAHAGPTDTSRDYELTNWSELERDANAFFPELIEPRPTAVL
jgi:menaquinone-dependent protoporphyrinogen oxidase